MVIQRIAQDLFSRTQQDQLPPWGRHPHSLAGAVGKELEKEGKARFKNSSLLIFAAVNQGTQASLRLPSFHPYYALHKGRYTGIASRWGQALGWE